MAADPSIDLAAQLEEARKEIAYYRRLAGEAGNIRLRETEELSRLISELRKTKEDLDQERAKFHSLAEQAPYGMAMIGSDGSFLYANPNFVEMFGYDLSEIPMGRDWFRKAYPDSAYRREVISAWLEDSKNCPVGKARPRIFSVTCKDGSQKIIHHRPVKLDTGEELITWEDITDLKRSEEQIRSSLKEKDAMLAEIHHRVKNNLAVVSSMLRLQSRYTADETHRRMFEECATRVNSMVLAHELLYHSKNLSDIRVKEYVSKLLHHLLGAMTAERSSVDLEKEIEDVVLGLDKLVPLGLILSELVSNSLEHAFPEEEKGQILVSFRSIGELAFELVVKDNGVGMPEDVDVQGGTSMGLELVRILATQLGGKIKIVTDKGTQVSIRI
jgi:PAS domain S-box-containing protein